MSTSHETFREEFRRRLNEQIADFIGGDALKLVVPTGRAAFNFAVHLPEKDGTTAAIQVLCIPATIEQTRHYNMAPPLRTGLEWSATPMVDRMAWLDAAGLPPSKAPADDMIEILPKAARDYLAFWQRQINSAECYFSCHEMGARVNWLLERGYIMNPRILRTTWYGHHVLPRDRVPNSEPGSHAFVESVMGPKYARWIADVAV